MTLEYATDDPVLEFTYDKVSLRERKFFRNKTTPTGETYSPELTPVDILRSGTNTLRQHGKPIEEIRMKQRGARTTSRTVEMR